MGSFFYDMAPQWFWGGLPELAVKIAVIEPKWALTN